MSHQTETLVDSEFDFGVLFGFGSALVITFAGCFMIACII